MFFFSLVFMELMKLLHCTIDDILTQFSNGGNMDTEIDVNDIHDAFALGDWGLIDANLIAAFDTVNQGGKVSIVRRYSNASPDIVKTISTLQELTTWKNHLEKMFPK